MKTNTSSSPIDRKAPKPGFIKQVITFIDKSILTPISKALQKFGQFLFGKKRRTPAEEGFMKPIRVKLGPFNIHIQGVPGDKRYHEVKIIAEEVKQVFEEYPINIQLTDVSSKAEGAYPKTYIDGQLWYVGQIDYEMMFFEIHSLIKKKEEKIRQMKEQLEDLRDKHRYFIVYSPAYFDNGVDSNRTRMLVPTKYISFDVKNLLIIPKIHRKGLTYSMQLHQSYLRNNQPIYDFTPYDVEPSKLEQVFMADGTMQWVK